MSDGRARRLDLTRARVARDPCPACCRSSAPWRARSSSPRPPPRPTASRPGLPATPRTDPRRQGRLWHGRRSLEPRLAHAGRRRADRGLLPRPRHASALLAAGDHAGGERALDYLFTRQQKPDASFPQNSTVQGAQHWTNLQLDEVALPIVLAWQLHREYSDNVKRAADFIVANGPSTPQERWENQSGWSPGTIAAEIAGLVCAADLARQAGAAGDAARYEATADEWQSKVEGWTATTNGPYSPAPYYLRLTKDADPNAGTTYSIGDSGPSAADQRSIVDPSYLELVRLDVKRPEDPTISNTCRSSIRSSRSTPPTGASGPLQVRRLRRDARRRAVGHHVPGGQPDHDRARLADPRRRARRVRARLGQRGECAVGGDRRQPRVVACRYVRAC
jgi:hypothetical protein